MDVTFFPSPRDSPVNRAKVSGRYKLWDLVKDLRINFYLRVRNMGKFLLKFLYELD